MAKIYVIKHRYDVDGGYGDAVSVTDTIFVTNDKEKAEAWVEHWSHPFTYDTPYVDLMCCEFYVEEIDVIDDIDIHTPPTTFDGFYDVGSISSIEDPETYKRIPITDGEEIHKRLIDVSEEEQRHDKEQEDIFNKTERELMEKYYAKYGERMINYAQEFKIELEKALNEAGYERFHNGTYLASFRMKDYLNDVE